MLRVLRTAAHLRCTDLFNLLKSRGNTRRPSILGRAGFQIHVSIVLDQAEGVVCL